ncbi:MAG: TIGR03545 family protein [Endomicrobiia bacterium]|nr:TIGR03545 family protein [Endomicrobiia bacterium]
MRWKFIAPFAAVVAVVAAFNILFLDALLKKAVVASGEAAFGAKVDVARLKTKFSDLSARIEGLSIADKNDVWKNIAQAKSIRFAVRPYPLLSAKVNIEEMSVEGLKFGTPRKTSGALPPRVVKKIEKQDKPGVASRLMSALYEKGKTQVASLPAASSIKDARAALSKISPDMVKLDDLESPRELEKMKEGLAHKYVQNKERLENLNLSARLAPVSSAVAEASKIKISAIEEAQAAAPALENLKNAGEHAQNALVEIQALKTQIAADFGEEKDILRALEDLKNADLKKLSDKLKLPSLPSGNISEALFGRAWIGRVNTAVYYIGLVRKYMPARKKTDKTVERPRLKGRDIEFPGGPSPRPKFLVEKILIQGEFGPPESPTVFSGVATDFTSDPSLWGKPARIKLAGSGGGRSLDIQAIFDHTGEAAKDSFAVSYKGIDGKSLGLPESEYLPSFENSRAAVEVSFDFADDEINSRLGLKVGGVSYRASLAEGDDETRKILSDIWKGIDELSLAARISGRVGDLRFSVESGIDKILSERMKKIFGEKLAEAQTRLRAEVNRLTDEKRAEVMKEYNERKAAIMSECAVREKEARSQIDAIRDKTEEVRAKIKEIEDREKKRAEEEKRKAEEELKKQGGEKFEQLKRNIFK